LKLLNLQKGAGLVFYNKNGIICGCMDASEMWLLSLFRVWLKHFECQNSRTC
jgi:hypothetical protein